jgi:hypothetical protein
LIKPLKLLAVPAIALALLAAGCGDDDDEDTTSATDTSTATTEASATPTLEQWLANADEVCAAGDQELAAAAEEQFGNEPPSEAELEQFGTELMVPALQAQHDGIAALPKPEEEAERIDEMLAALQEGTDEIEADPALLVQGNDSVPGIAEATKIAQELGLTDCGSG